jgi:hypothetical protein
VPEGQHDRRQDAAAAGLARKRKPGFAITDAEMFDVLEHLGDPERVLLHFLLSYRWTTEQSGGIRPKHVALAGRLRKTRRSIIRSFNRLIEVGLVFVKSRPAPGLHQANEYGFADVTDDDTRSRIIARLTRDVEVTRDIDVTRDTGDAPRVTSVARSRDVGVTHIKTRNKTRSKRRRAARVSQQSLPPIPAELDTPEFRRAWEDWVRYLAVRRSRLAPQSAELQLRECVGWGVARSVAAIEHSIRKNYTGLYEKRVHNAENGQRMRGADLERRDNADVVAQLNVVQV